MLLLGGVVLAEMVPIPTVAVRLRRGLLFVGSSVLRCQTGSQRNGLG